MMEADDEEGATEADVDETAAAAAAASAVTFDGGGRILGLRGTDAVIAATF